MQETKRIIVDGPELTSSLKKGIDKLSDTVKVTMGPKGRLVLIQRPHQHPLITKDGVTVAQSINLEDEVENLGAQIIKEAAARTADEAGDGSTSATVLAQSIYSEGQKMIAAGFDVVGLCKGIRLACDLVTNHIDTVAKEVNCENDLMQVALISANGESEISKLIVNAIQAAGVDGHVIVEEAKGFKSSLTVVDGYQIDRGYLSPYFISDKNKMNCTFNDPLILLADRNFSSIHELMKPLEAALDMSRSILVIANEIDGDAMQGLVLNRVKGSLQVCAIKSPGFGAARHDLLNDLQSIVGGKVINSSFDMQSFSAECFGTCKKVIIKKSSALFINDNDENFEVSNRIDSIKSKLEDPSIDKNEKELLTYRLQQLSGGIAILRVGASTESELIERYDRVDDALNATKAAMQEGIIPGGGVALARSSKYINIEADEQKNLDVAAGMRVVSKSCLAPFKQIIINSGESPELILKTVLSNAENVGYDSRENKYGDMFELGIVDPKKVVRCSIENAASAASMLLSVKSSLIEVSKN